MADREIVDKLSSGEILLMRIGGSGAGDVVPTMDDIDSYSVYTTTSDFVVTTSSKVVLVDASSNNVTITLPSAASIGKVVYIKRIDSSSNIVVVDVSVVGETIDTSSYITLSSLDSVGLAPSTNKYWII